MVVEGSHSQRVGVLSSGYIWIIKDLEMLILNAGKDAPARRNLACSYLRSKLIFFI